MGLDDEGPHWSRSGAEAEPKRSERLGAEVARSARSSPPSISDVKL